MQDIHADKIHSYQLSAITWFVSQHLQATGLRGDIIALKGICIINAYFQNWLADRNQHQPERLATQMPGMQRVSHPPSVSAVIREAGKGLSMCGGFCILQTLYGLFPTVSLTVTCLQ